MLPVCEELGIGFVPYSPLGGASSPGDRQHTAFDSSDNADAAALYGQEARQANSGSSTCCGETGSGRAPPRPSSCWPGSLAQAAVDRADPGDHQNCTDWRRTFGAAAVELTSDELGGTGPRCVRGSRSWATGTPRSSSRRRIADCPRAADRQRPRIARHNRRSRGQGCGEQPRHSERPIDARRRRHRGRDTSESASNGRE